MNSEDLLDAGKNHYQARKDSDVREVKVPELDWTFYIYPLTIGQKNYIAKQATDKGIYYGLVASIVIRAKDENGKPVFPPGKRDEALEKIASYWDADLVDRIGQQMAAVPHSFEDAEGESRPTES